MLIQKQTSGRVLIYDAGVPIADLSESCTMRLAENRAGIIISDLSGVAFKLPFWAANETQIMPAAAVDFSGTLTDLWTLLTTYFFVELHTSTGGGGVVEANITGQSGTYSILTTDYIIYATDTLSVRLPNIGTSIGQVYRIFANGFNVLVSCNTPAGDTILGEATQTMTGMDMVTFRAISSNSWLAAD